MMKRDYLNKMRNIAFLLLVCASFAQAEQVAKLEPVAGAETEYSVESLLRVELEGDSIRFIEKDGSVAAEVYKYDYVKLTFAEKEDQAIQEPKAKNHDLKAQKILHNGQIYILFGGKAYHITGAEVR